MTTQVTTTCELCGAVNVPVRHGLVRWVNPAFGEYNDVDRCVDVEACKARVAAAGDPWPVEDPKR